MSYLDNMRSCLASVLLSQHRTDEAIAILRSLVVKRERELRKTELGKTDPETLVTMMNLGRAMLQHGDYNEARVLLKEAVARSSASRGDNHIDTARCQKYLTLIEQASGRLEEAEKLFRIVKDKFHDLVPAEQPQALLSIIDWAVVIENQKKYGEAERLYRYALDTYNNTLGETHLTTLETTSKLLHVLYLQGKHEIVRAIGRELLDAASIVTELEQPPLYARCWELLINSFPKRWKDPAAFELCRKQLSSCAASCGESGGNTILTLHY